MKLRITKDYKSLKSCQIELPNFTVLTGLNGSGKTQVLEGIAGKRFEIQYQMSYRGGDSPQVDKFIILEENDEELSNIKFAFPYTLGPSESVQVKRVDEIWQGYSQDKLNSFVNVDKTSYDLIAEKSDKSINDLQELDFATFTPLNKLNSSQDVFARNFSNLFETYLKYHEKNEYCRYKSSNGSSIHRPLSEQSFKALHGNEPWLLLNKIFTEAQVGYTVTIPNLNEFDRDSSYTFRLINESGNEVGLNDLSSGEKVIFSLLFALYNANFDVDFPQVLLLDEPDSSLHPAMCKQLVDVLLNLFVKQKGVKVIMTTHSPSTIALCPEDSIYVINKLGSQIEKIRKDDALKILTSGIPTLSIDYKGHKQIIIESPTDGYYYQVIYNKLFQSKDISSKLYFIASGGYGKGSCDQVRKICNDFREAGTESVFGIIDWDARNSEDRFVKVHGEANRYSLENYLLDPIYLICLFMINDSENVRRDLALDKSYNEYSIGEQPIDVLQSYIKWFFDKIYCSSPFRSYKSKDIDRLSVKFHNGVQYSLPSWYVKFSGHDLSEKLKTTFTSLSNSKYNNEGKLQEELSNLIGKCFPFVPLDTVSLLKSF